MWCESHKGDKSHKPTTPTIESRRPDPHKARTPACESHPRVKPHKARSPTPRFHPSRVAPCLSSHHSDVLETPVNQPAPKQATSSMNSESQQPKPVEGGKKELRVQHLRQLDREAAQCMSMHVARPISRPKEGTSSLNLLAHPQLPASIRKANQGNIEPLPSPVHTTAGTQA